MSQADLWYVLAKNSFFQNTNEKKKKKKKTPLEHSKTRIRIN